MEQLSEVNQPNMSWSDPDSWVHSCERSVVSCACFCVCCKAEITGILPDEGRPLGYPLNC